jgi:gamma-glutamylputrescine oxidase
MDILTANDRIGEYPRSYYAATANTLAPFPAAEGDISCDVCVVGGGFTGLSSALHLAQKGFDVVLLDAHRVGWGASGRNGGQVGTGQRLDQDELEKLVGRDHARELWELSLESVSIVGDLIRAYDIDCDYAAGIIRADHRQRFVAHSHRYARKLREDYGYKLIHELDQREICRHIGSKAYFGGALDMGSGHMHPLNFALGLAKAAQQAGVRIFERSRVTALEETSPARVTTDKADITARFVALGCNGYLGRLQPNVATRVMPINNFIIATEQLSDADAKALIQDNHAVADSNFVVNYFRRSSDNRLLFGGGETYGYNFPKDIAVVVKKPMLKIFPQLDEVRIDYSWGGTLGITMNRMPHFSRLSGNILSAGGFSGHGVAMATLAGRLIADAIDGQAGAFDVMEKVPSPRFPGGAALRWPLLVLGMSWFALRDRL